VGLDAVLDTLDKVGDFRLEWMVGDVAAIGADGGEIPVFEAARIVAGRVALVILHQAVAAKEAAVEVVVWRR
jgi:hypothetical protein